MTLMILLIEYPGLWELVFSPYRSLINYCDPQLWLIALKLLSFAYGV